MPDNNSEATSSGYVKNDHSSCVLHVPILAHLREYKTAINCKCALVSELLGDLD